MSHPRTRMGLLAARAQLALVRQARVLLEQKRDALLQEFYREVRTTHTAYDELEAAAGAARLALAQARIRLGPGAVAAAAASTMGRVEVDVTSISVMGVPVPVVESPDLVRGAVGRGRAFDSGAVALELCAQRFEEEMTLAIRVASLEVRLRRLAREIRRTSSRVNALRTRIVPELEAETAGIAFALEQREREDRFRLKRVKARREQRAAAAH